MTTIADYKTQRDALLEFIKNAPVSSGVCCCGNDMTAGGCDGHTSVDMWDNSVRQWVKDIEQSDRQRASAANNASSA